MENLIPITRNLDKYNLFQKIIAKVSQTHAIHKTTTTDEFISVCWMTNSDNGGVAQMTEAIKSKCNHSELQYKIPIQNQTKQFTNILYNIAKDKISIGEFNTGWFWANKKSKFYPGKKSRPLICYSKKFYVFHHKDRKPRLMNGSNIGLWNGPVQTAALELLGLTYKPLHDVSIQAKYYIDTTDEWQAMENALGIKIPKALKSFNKRDLYNLISCLKNPGELNSICQYLSKNKAVHVPLSEEDWGTPYNDIYGVLWKMLYKTLNTSNIIVKQPEDNKAWLLRDYFSDLHALKRKGSLKITSIKRLEDEHRKMSRERQMLNIKAIKVHDCYKEMFKTCTIPGAELITNKKRLLAEGINQEHCVASYGNQINSGSCCIISIPYQNKQWTLQISNNGNIFIKNQFKGHRNTEAPEELHHQVLTWLSSLPPLPPSKDKLLKQL